MADVILEKDLDFAISLEVFGNKKELKIYLVDLNDEVYEGELNNFSSLTSDEEFISIAKRQGNVYSIEEFQREWNIDNLIYNSFIRFIWA